ncbi:unnamed protein product [Darwinula stevensoni]|uniref:Glucosidase II subunit alpha n=1 Tax=Darwinula stevensoni TaxID=69355 RepID=A0A7R8X5B2_9CRUS|nr:unnamed protein product [Darwinula stevensoni]CAG0886935.1 unnamed protein product [Darwinula stevensoni]
MYRKMLGCARRICVLTFLALCVGLSTAVERHKFKTCQQSAFCRRNRELSPGESAYHTLLETLRVDDPGFLVELLNTKTGRVFQLEVNALKDNSLRMKITEKAPLQPRFEVDLFPVLNGTPAQSSLQLLQKNADVVKFTLKEYPESEVHLYVKPFKIELLAGGEPVIIANARGLFNFEHTREHPKSSSESGTKSQGWVHSVWEKMGNWVGTGRKSGSEDEVQNPSETEGDGEKKENEHEEVLDGESDKKIEVEGEGEKMKGEEEEEEREGMWEESFGGHKDSKPNGPTAVAMDFLFPKAQEVYGLPEHGDHLPLRNTRKEDPYRLYNLDVFEYEVWNQMALYGSIPFMLAHGDARTVGILWLNAAETWIDVEKQSGSILNFVSGGSTDGVNTHWISESGIIDVFFYLGPRPKDIMRQNALVTGSTPLPQYFAVGFHHSRWNYKDEEDVRTVDANFDIHHIPYDVLWLDIEHTDSKKYFTWDSHKFPNSIEMINSLASRGRKMVTIVDPHIKKDGGYFLHQEASSRGYYVKNSKGDDYDGWCWPGSSAYLDFLSEEVQDYWASLYSLDKYQGSTLDLYTWNDMNEPSVFNGPEVTMPKDLKHVGGWEHRDVHNLYGFLNHMSTHKGHLLRSNGQLRPFILTRAAFVGSQRYAAIWTGDNMAKWEHLKATIPMCISLSLAGMSFCGADVGGFFQDPSEELLIRWYQAAVFQPFLRVHSHIDTKRREPWLFSENALRIFRDTIRKRYSYLPLWYTLFYENEIKGMPPMRPLWMEYPTDRNTFTMEDQHLLGDALLVHPVTDEGAKSVTVYFPGQGQLWYDTDTFELFSGAQSIDVPVNLDKVPVYQRGGTVISKKERMRRSSALTHHDPYTLVVALDAMGGAQGTLYIDDGVSFEYRKNHHLYIEFVFENDHLISRKIHEEAYYNTKSWLEKVLVVGYKRRPTEIFISSHDHGIQPLHFKYDEEQKLLTIRKPDVNMATDFRIEIK